MQVFRISTIPYACLSGPENQPSVSMSSTIETLQSGFFFFFLTLFDICHSTGVKEEIGFNPALCELAGHLLIKGFSILIQNLCNNNSNSVWYSFSEGPAYEMVTEKEASQLLDSITTPWFHQVGAHIGHLF